MANIRAFSELAVLKACPLFKGIAEGDLKKLLFCLSGRKKTAAKDAFILAAGEGLEKRGFRAGRSPPGKRSGSTVPMGLLLSGRLRIVQDDFWGNRSILASITPGELFGEALSCAGVEIPPVSVVAAEESQVLLFDCTTMLEICRAACPFHITLINNLMKILAEKNVMLVKKLEHVSRRRIREKILSYLSDRALETGRDRFTLPYNRQELADYLSVDRSALSRELGRLRDEGVLSFRKNLFTMKKTGLVQ
jgi:CRP-like cAMP-binding protein